MFKERTREILETSVRDFIKTGKPVTSERLYAEYDFGIKPAMIRWELNDLTSGGYLYQNHPSGGRIPSDRAYKIFVEDLMIALADETPQIPSGIGDWFPKERRRFVRKIAKTLEVLSIWYESNDDAYYNSGMDELFEKLGLTELEELVNLAQDIENIPEQLARNKSWWSGKEEWPRVFIGGNPFIRNKRVSVVAERIVGPEEEICLLAAIGPKNMNYEKSIKLCKGLRTLIN